VPRPFEAGVDSKTKGVKKKEKKKEGKVRGGGVFSIFRRGKGTDAGIIYSLTVGRTKEERRGETPTVPLVKGEKKGGGGGE